LNDEPRRALARHKILVVFPVPGGPWKKCTLLDTFYSCKNINHILILYPLKLEKMEQQIRTVYMFQAKKTYFYLLVFGVEALELSL